MKKILCSKFVLLLVMLISFCSVSPGYAEDDSEGSFASLSPEFLQWQKEHTQQSKSSGIPAYYSSSSSEHPNGYIPIPVDFSHLAKNLPVENENADKSPVLNVKADSLPSAFDLRNVNGKSYVSSVKSQSPWGTCWAHAAIGSMESNYMMQGKSELDLSEMHVAWFSYKNSDKSRAFGNEGSSSFRTVMNLGGNSYYPAALFARLSGPASESDVPYGTQPSASTPESYTRRLRLRDAYYLSMKDDLNVNAGTEQRNIVKRRIMQNGAVAANYYDDDSLFRKVESGNTSYHTTTKYPNHAIQIIGWDDNYSASNFRTKPSSNGAWLIKNSWGDRWYTYNGYMGDSGCFWMSYETYLTDGTSFVVEDVNNNMKVYEYDPLGICTLWGYSGSTVYAANVFRSEGDETLTEIGIYTADNNLGYEINIYTGMSSMPSKTPVNGSSVSSSSGTLSFAGYHTITLDTPVKLSEGEYFSVVVKFTGYAYVPVEYAFSGFSDNAVIEDGSFFSRNGTSWETGVKNRINACIKAFTLTDSASGTAPKIYDGYPPDGQLNTEYSATLKASGTKPVTWSVIRGTLPTGLTLDADTGTISGIPTDTTSRTFTIQAENAYGSDTKTFTMNVFSVPSITTVSLEGYAGYAFTGQLTLSKSVNAAWEATTSMPSGLKLNENTGAINGKPSRPGEYTVTFQATTSLGVSVKNVTIIIYDKPEKPAIRTSSLTQGYINEAYSHELVITGTTPINIKAEGLPGGLSVNSSTGLISGTPVTAGNYSVKITAENIATELENKPVTRTLKLVIKAQPPEITFNDDALPDATVGEAYSYTFTLSSGTDSVTWKASGLPAGIKFSNGTLSGTPTKAGNFKINLTVSNSAGKTTLKIPFTVLQTPVITISRLANATTGKRYTAKISAKGTTPVTWNIDGLPDTLTYSSNSQGTILTITGTPEEMNTYPLTINATNAAGTSSVNAELKVNGVAPKLKASLAKGYAGSSYTGSNISATGTRPITFAYSISNSDKKKFGVEDLDDLGLSFNYDADEGTTEITGTPTSSVKALPITITAENAASNGKPVSRTVKLTISGAKPAFTEPDDSTITMKVLQNESISLNFTVTGTPDITFSMNKANGFTLTQTGEYTATLSGTAPSRDGKVNITVTAANADGKATRKVIIQTYTAPSITTSSLKTGTLNKSYNSKISVTGTKTITWTLEGELPDGMRFRNGTLSGKPTEAGTFELSLTAENDAGTDTQEFTLTITDPNNVMSIPQEESEHEDAYHDDASIPEETEASAEYESESKSDSESAITFGHERNEYSLSAGQSAVLSEGGYTVVKVLPEIKVSESAMYDIEIELDESVETGAELIWFAFPKDNGSTSDDEIAEFYDESGKEITCVPESHKFTVGAWLNEGVIYEPVIAVKSEK